MKKKRRFLADLYEKYFSNLYALTENKIIYRFTAQDNQLFLKKLILFFK